MLKITMNDGTVHIASKISVSNEIFDGYTKMGIDLWDGCYVGVKECNVVSIVFIGIDENELN